MTAPHSAAYLPQRLLITGGCGFIGSNFIRLLLEQPETTCGECLIVNYDLLTYAGNPENLSDLARHPRYRFVQGDVCDGPLLASVLEREAIDTVIHFAAESHVDRSILDSGPFVRTNVVGTQVLLDACRRQQVQRYVQVSTDEVYGSLGAEGYFTETTPLTPNSPYSASKAAADLLVQSYCHTFQFPALITRCSNNYGPYQFPEKLIPLCLANALQDKPIPVYGDGQQVRDWIHVLDQCRGIVAALRQGQLGEVYNFGGNSECPNLLLVQTLLQILGKPESLIQFVRDRPGHDRRYAIDARKAERELGWKPEFEFAAGLEQTVDWYQQHADWMKRVISRDYRHFYQQQYGDQVSE